MMKLCGISRSSAILWSDSPQSNNRKDHSLWVTPFIPRERPNVKHAIAGYLRLPRPTSAPALMRVLGVIGHGRLLRALFLLSPDKGLWACLGDLPADMPRWPKTRVSLCNLMLKLRGMLTPAHALMRVLHWLRS